MDPFDFEKYTIKKKFYTPLGSSFYVFNSKNELSFFSKIKSYKFNEPLKIYSGEDMKYEYLYILSRKSNKFSFFYDVYDSFTNDKIGSIVKSGIRSIFVDNWAILDTNDNPIGSIKDKRKIFSILSTFSSNFIPKSLLGEINGVNVLKFKQKFHPFRFKLDLHFSANTNEIFDKRLGLAAANIICVLENQ